MATADAIDLQYIVDTTVELCRIPSPTGFTHQAAERVCDLLRELGVPFETTVKGSIVAHLPSAAGGPGRLLSAHIDTLGAMVREIKGDGRLKLSLVGGFDWSTIEGEYCLVHRASGDPVSGTILTTKASYHVHGSALVDLKRDADSMEVRLDELVSSADDVRSLGIEVGDFVSLDSRTTVTNSGFIKSRHIDDKACAAICLGVAKAVVDGDLTLPAPTALYFSVFEEVGHGTSAGIPDGVRDVIAVDMAAVGAGQRSDERK
ncbi:MAG: peptidase M42, partial [Chloroflexota bacterium]|nr:peptidase M42 [Chloroflexota bacterium]